MKTKKVAFIGHSYVESSARQKLSYLAKSTTLRLITPSWYPTPFGRYSVDFEFYPELEVEAYPIHFFNLKRTSTRWVLRTYDLGFKHFRPDIIHIDNEQHSWITCQALLCRKLFAPNAKVVVFVWGNIRTEEQGIKAKALEKLARINRKYMDFFICGNAEGKQILLEKGVSENKVEVVPQFGIDPNMFSPFVAERRDSVRLKLGLSQNDFAIGYVGRFVEEKGLLDLVEAAGRLHASSKRTPVLVLTGRGPLERTVQDRCAAFGLKLLVFPPRMNHEVVETMNALDVLVLPSQSRPFWKEQFGRVLIEAMGCGTPVIGSDSGDIPNVIGDAGLIFPECDRESLYQCLERYYIDDGFRVLYGQRGLHRVLTQFTNQRIAQRTLEIYKRIA